MRWLRRGDRLTLGRLSKDRDARTGALVSVQQTDLRIGANYSWSRGAAWLVKNRLLDTQAQR